MFFYSTCSSAKIQQLQKTIFERKFIVSETEFDLGQHSSLFWNLGGGGGNRIFHAWHASLNYVFYNPSRFYKVQFIF